MSLVHSVVTVHELGEQTLYGCWVLFIKKQFKNKYRVVQI